MAFTAQLTHMAQMGSAIMQTAAGAGPAGLNVGSRATITLGNKPFVQRKATGRQAFAPPRRPGAKGQELGATAVADFNTVPGFVPSHQWESAASQNEFQNTHFSEPGRLPQFLQRLTDPDASADFPPAHRVDLRSLDNRELDKLVAALGKSALTWRRALQLHEWLLGLGHVPDDRLCTTLMRVCSQHNHTLEALNLYNWMRTPKREGGAGLRPSVYTYTGAMRAALVGNLPDKALQIWEDAMNAKCQYDCRMCTTLIEVCTRKGHTERALEMYDLMRVSAQNPKMAPTVHAYTAAMRAAAEGGKWQRALDIWQDLQNSGCSPSGHAYAAAISACAAGGKWQQAVSMFDTMMESQIRPDVVSCTALITALAADGQWHRAEHVVEWMLKTGVKPNVRTYTALVTAMGNARQWDRALETIQKMKYSESWSSNVEPNAYTYSALLKAMGEQGEWQLAERLFNALETEAVGSIDLSEDGIRLGQTINGETSVSGSNVVPGPQLKLNRLNISHRQGSDASLSSVGSAEYGYMPTALAEEVLKSNSPRKGAGSTSPTSSPESIQEQNRNGDHGLQYSLFSHNPIGLNGTDLLKSIWTTAPMSLLSETPFLAQSSVSSPAFVDPAQENSSPSRGSVPHRSPYLNEVVCGAMMLAYERSGCSQKAVDLLHRAKRLGIEPNTIMFNTAISALGKNGRWEAAETLFHEIPKPDAVSFETMVVAYGLAGNIEKCERVFSKLLDAGYIPKDYAFCGLIAAYGNNGDWRAALRVRQRMRSMKCAVSVHIFNTLIAVCGRANQLDAAMDQFNAMRLERIQPDQVTKRLMDGIGKQGVASVEGQQVVTAALTAAVAAAGSIIIRAGLF